MKQEAVSKEMVVGLAWGNGKEGGSALREVQEAESISLDVGSVGEG